MIVKERLIEFIKSQRISNTEFCNTIGVSKAFVSSMRKSLQPDKLNSIALHYPQLNINWLLTGDGQMLYDNKANHESSEIDNKRRIQQLESDLAEKDKTINKLLALQQDLVNIIMATSQAKNNNHEQK